MSVTLQPIAPLRRAFTLSELLVVILIIAGLSTLVLPQLAGKRMSAQVTVTKASLVQLRQIVLDDYRDDAFAQLPFPIDATRVKHPQLAYLYVNPETFVEGGAAGTTESSYDTIVMRGWNGPYALNSGTYVADVDRGFSTHYGRSGDPAPLDAWGNPIVLQQPIATEAGFSATSLSAARLVSAGPDGVIDTPLVKTSLTLADVNDDIVLPLQGSLLE